MKPSAAPTRLSDCELSVESVPKTYGVPLRELAEFELLLPPLPVTAWGELELHPASTMAPAVAAATAMPTAPLLRGRKPDLLVACISSLSVDALSIGPRGP
jgi:hypothetical protein